MYKIYFLYLLLFVKYDTLGQTIFANDTINFIDFSFNMTSSIDTELTCASRKSNSGQFRMLTTNVARRYIHIDSNDNVYWQDYPLDSIEDYSLNKDASVNQASIHMSCRFHSLPLFKTALGKDKIYYQVSDRSSPVIMQASLKKDDTTHTFFLPILSDSRIGDYIFDGNIFNDFPHTYITYISDTTFHIFNIDVPCYYFKGTDERPGKQIIQRDLFIEKKSLLPIVEIDKIYKYYDETNRQTFGVKPSKKLTNVDIIMPYIRGLSIHVKES